MRLEISDFGGMAPLLDPTALADNFATLAKNVRLDRGVLAPGAFSLKVSPDYPDPWMVDRGVKSVAKLLESNTRFAFSHSEGATAFVSPVAPADTWGRVYFMTESGPSFTTSDRYSAGQLSINPLSYRLGVAAPSAKPYVMGLDVTQKTQSGESDSVAIEPDYVSVAYAYTFVDKYGHESSLSPASLFAKLPYNRSFEATVFFDNKGISTRTNMENGVKRLYRATFDGSSSQWQFLADMPVGDTTFVDTISLGDEGEVAVSEGWLPAPDELRGLCLVASSYAAGFFGHYVCYSELKLPHAWPAELQYPVKYTPVKILPMLNGLLVATTGRPYWAEGADPYSAIPRELPINAPCISGDSLVDMGDYAMYVSLEGLVAVGSNQAEIVTASILDRSEMASLVDDTCKAFAFEGRYVFSTSDGRWLAFVPQKGVVEYDFGYTPDQFKAVSFSVRDNLHYFSLGDSTVRVVDHASTASGVEWHSKHWRTPPGSFSCFRVEADAYPVTVTVRCQYMSQPWRESPALVVDGPHLQRLPVMTGGLWQVVIQPPENGRVYRVLLGQSGQETS